MVPFVSVVVVTKNEEKSISECLESLVTQDYPKDKYEIIVVDGASRDKTVEICRRYPVKLVLDRDGISHQRNTGIKEAKGKYLAFTDADCVADKSWLRRLVEQMGESNKDVVAVGGPNLVFDDDPPLSRVIGYTQELLLGSGGSPQSHRITQTKYVYSIPNCNILYRKEIVARERYDESLSIGDDCELNFRLKQKGYKFLFFPDTVVWHHRANSLWGFARKMFFYGEGNGRITRKHRKIIRWFDLPVALITLLVLFSYLIISFFPSATYAYGSVFLLYLTGLLLSTAQVYKRHRNITSLAVLILLPIQHFAYGFGFLKGLLGIRGAE